MLPILLNNLPDVSTIIYDNNSPKITLPMYCLPLSPNLYRFFPPREQVWSGPSLQTDVKTRAGPWLWFRGAGDAERRGWATAVEADRRKPSQQQPLHQPRGLSGARLTLPAHPALPGLPPKHNGTVLWKCPGRPTLLKWLLSLYQTTSNHSGKAIRFKVRRDQNI